LAAPADSFGLADVRRLLRSGLSRRSEPVLVMGDRFIPAVALWAGALQHQRRTGDGISPLIATDLDRVHAAIAAAWSGELAIPTGDRPSPRRSALVVATPWVADGRDANIVLSLLGGSALVVRPNPDDCDELLEALLRWKPWRAEITEGQLAWLRRHPEGRHALTGFGHLLVVPSTPVPSAQWPAQRIS
jgi:hypothetical protein